MKLLTIFALISACAAGIIPSLLISDDQTSEADIAAFKTPSVKVENAGLKWIEWRKQHLKASRLDGLDKKSQGVNVKPQNEEIQISLRKFRHDSNEDSLENIKPQTLAEVNDFKNFLETGFQNKGLQSIETPENLSEINTTLHSSETSKLPDISEISVLVETTLVNNESNPLLIGIEKLSGTMLEEMAESNHTEQTSDDEVQSPNISEILHTNTLESEQSDEQDSDPTLLTILQGNVTVSNKLDVNILEQNSTNLTHDDGQSEKNTTILQGNVTVSNELDVNILEPNSTNLAHDEGQSEKNTNFSKSDKLEDDSQELEESTSTIYPEETFVTEKAGSRHNESLVFYVDSIESSGTSIADSEGTSEIENINRHNESQVLHVDSVKSTETDITGSEETSEIENIDNRHNESLVLYVDSVKSTDTDITGSKETSVHDASKLIDADFEADFEETTNFADFVETSESEASENASNASNALDVNMEKLLKMLNSTDSDEVTVLDLIRSGVTNASDILDLFNLAEPISFEVVTDNTSSIESFSVDENELMNDGSEIAMFQEVSTNGFEFLIDSDTAKNLFLKEILNTQSFLENDFSNVATLMAEEDSLGSNEASEYDLEVDETGSEMLEENHNVTVLMKKFETSTNLDLSESEKEVETKANTAKSNDVSTGHIPAVPTTSRPKKCPTPGFSGFCMFWFFSYDRCTRHSQCLENQMCCLNICSKRCFDV